MGWGLIVAGTHSGSGKTLVTLGLLRLLKEAQLQVQPFKVGPDYIDPQWHRWASGVASVNLDLFSFGDELPKVFSYYSQKVEASIVEGVMGLFDGDFSTFKVAKLLKLPIILVVDCFGLAETVSPLLDGIKRKVERAGLGLYVFLNRVSSERHLLRLIRALKKLKVIGYLPKDPQLELPSRHLGLILPEQTRRSEEVITLVAENLKKTLDLTELKRASFLLFPKDNLERRALVSFPFRKWGVALDQAFSFYYTHLLEELKARGELIFFSPLKDRRLPTEVEVIYLGGGYPEVFAEELASNVEMVKDLRDWVQGGGAVYAECGGLVYLSRTLRWEGKEFSLGNVYPFTVEKGGLSLGYRKIVLQRKNPFFPKGARLFGHEFHYTQITNREEDKNLKFLYRVKTLDGKTFREGFLYRRALASYVHLLRLKV